MPRNTPHLRSFALSLVAAALSCRTLTVNELPFPDPSAGGSSGSGGGTPPMSGHAGAETVGGWAGEAGTTSDAGDGAGGRASEPNAAGAGSGGSGGEGGIEGGAAGSNHGGAPNGPSEPKGGAAGQSAGTGGVPGGSPGAQGGRSPVDEEEKIYLASCAPGNLVEAHVLGAARDLAVVDRGDWRGAYAAYVTRPTANQVTLRWQFENIVRPLSLGWGSWECYGMVPGADRASYSYGAFDNKQLFVTSDLGRLYMRMTQPTWGWGDWFQIEVPYPGDVLYDIASTGYPDPTSLYLISGGEVLVRTRMDVLASASFSPWRSLGMTDARELAAARTIQGKQLLVAIDAEGDFFTTQGVTGASSSPFAEWQRLETPARFVKVDFAQQHQSLEEPEAVALDDQNRLWRCPDLEAGEWSQIATGTPIPALRAIAALKFDAQLILFGVDESGVVRASEEPFSDWLRL